MREIKFRAWDFEYKEMIYLENSGLQYYDFEGSYSLGFTVDGYDGFWAHEQYPEATKKASKFPIMQFTGLKDSQGKEIYESDLIKDNDGKIWEVIWFQLGWTLQSLDDEDDTLPMADFWEYNLIGNIYENPELISK